MISRPRLRGGFLFVADYKITFASQVGGYKITFAVREVSPPARRGRAGRWVPPHLCALGPSQAAGRWGPPRDGALGPSQAAARWGPPRQAGSQVPPRLPGRQAPPARGAPLTPCQPGPLLAPCRLGPSQHAAAWAPPSTPPLGPSQHPAAWVPPSTAQMGPLPAPRPPPAFVRSFADPPMFHVEHCCACNSCLGNYLPSFQVCCCCNSCLGNYFYSGSCNALHVKKKHPAKAA